MEAENEELLNLATAADEFLHAVTEARRIGRYSAWAEAERKGNQLRKLVDEVIGQRKLF